MKEIIERGSLRALRNAWQALGLSNETSRVGVWRVDVALSKDFCRVLGDCALLFKASHGRGKVLAVGE